MTRSVANHLNDITKTDPSLVLDRLSDWSLRGDQDPDELAWLTRHALRTLVKQGDPEAMELLGFRPDPAATITLDIATTDVVPGDMLEFTISADADEPLLIDYSIDFVKKSGERTPKVFKLKEVRARAGSVVVTKRHRLHANATTYTLYPGEHLLTILVNGTPTESAPFMVTEG